MKKQFNNIRVCAENMGSKRGFNIYLDFSGQREYLMSHRHNGLLFEMLKDGIYLNEMKRMKRGSRSGKVRTCSVKTKNSVEHLLLVIDDYLIDREAS